MDRIIEIFKKVQKIPYKVCGYDKTKIDKNLAFGDCRHKSELLRQLLEKEGYKVKKIRVIFDWKDLPIPKPLLDILKPETKFVHRLLKVRINKEWVKVDCTWSPELEKIGFPVTKDWDGKSDTKQVTNGKLDFYEEKDFDKIKLLIDKEKALKFAEELNKFLDN
jgi:hypothetical protein